MIKIRRVYEPSQKKDGYRVLIDRLWPRGIKKSELEIDAWLKDLAPSNELRKSFGHDPKKWGDFQKKYKAELRSPAARELISDLAKRGAKGTVTLVYSAKDPDHNNAVVLKDLLEREIRKLSPRKALH